MELVLGLGGVISVPDKATFDLQDAVLVGAGRHPVLVGRVASGSIFHGDCLRVLMDDGTVSVFGQLMASPFVSLGWRL